MMKFCCLPPATHANGTPVAGRVLAKVEVVGSRVARLPGRRQLGRHGPLVTAANVHQDGEAFFLRQDARHGRRIGKVLVGHRQEPNVPYDVGQDLQKPKGLNQSSQSG